MMPSRVFLTASTMAVLREYWAGAWPGGDNSRAVAPSSARREKSFRMSHVPFGNPATSAEDCRLQREGTNLDWVSTLWHSRSALSLQTVFRALRSLHGGPSAFRPRL